MQLNAITVVSGFLSQQECQQLNDWAQTAVQNNWAKDGVNFGYANGENSYRKTTRQSSNEFQFPSFVIDISNRITSQLSLQSNNKAEVGDGTGIICTVTLTGGTIVEHTDPLCDNGSRHLISCNVLTQKSESGGELFLDGNLTSLQQGDLVMYSPSTVRHSVSKVSGSSSRIMWLFGYQNTEQE